MLHFQAKCPRSSGPPMLLDCSSGTAALLQSLRCSGHKPKSKASVKRRSTPNVCSWSKLSFLMTKLLLKLLAQAALLVLPLFFSRSLSVHFNNIIHTCVFGFHHISNSIKNTSDLAAVSFFSFFLDSNRAATSITTSPLCRSFLRNDKRIAGLIESLTKCRLCHLQETNLPRCLTSICCFCFPRSSCMNSI